MPLLCDIARVRLNKIEVSRIFVSRSFRVLTFKILTPLPFCYCKKRIYVSFSCVCPAIDHEFRHNIVKVAVDQFVKSLVVSNTCTIAWYFSGFGFIPF